MPEPWNPFAELFTPEFQQADPYNKFLRYQEVIPLLPDYMNLNSSEREMLRNKILGYQDSQQLYDDLVGTAKDSDSVTKNRLFNAMMADDPYWQDAISTEQKQKLRGELVGPTVAGEEYKPPTGRDMPTRAMHPLSPQEAQQGLFDLWKKDKQEEQQQNQEIMKQIAEEQFFSGGPMAGGPDAMAWDIMGGLSKTPYVKEYLNPFLGAVANLPGSVAKVGAATMQAAKEFVPVGPTGGAALIGSLLRDDVIKKIYEWGKEYSEAAEMAIPAQEVARVEDIHGIGDAIKWGLGSLGQMSGFVAQMAAGQAVAGTPGALLMSVFPNTAEVIDAVYRETGELHPELSLPLGLASSALDTAGFEVITASWTKPVKKRVKNAILNWFVDKYMSGGIEGLTEIAQEDINIIAERLSAEDRKLLEALTPEEKSRMLNVGLSGFLGGVFISSSGEQYRDRLTDRERAAIDASAEEIAALEALAQKLVMAGVTPSATAGRAEQMKAQATRHLADIDLANRMAEEWRARTEGVQEEETPPPQPPPEGPQRPVGGFETERGMVEPTGRYLTGGEQVRRPPMALPSSLFEQPEIGGAVVVDQYGRAIPTGRPLVPSERLPMGEHQRQMEAEAEQQARPRAIETPLTAPISGPEGIAAEVGAAGPRPTTVRPETQIDEAVAFMRNNGFETGAALLDRLNRGEDLTVDERTTLDQQIAQVSEIQPEIGFIAEQLSQRRLQRPDIIETREDLEDAIVNHVANGADSLSAVQEALKEQNRYEIDRRTLATRVRQLDYDGRITRERIKGKYQLGIPTGEEAAAPSVIVDEYGRQIEGKAEPTAPPPDATRPVTPETGIERAKIPEGVTPEGGREFASRAVPALEARIAQLQHAMINTNGFINSGIYDGTYPLPETGGIVEARRTERYRTDPEYRQKIDKAFKDINDTLIRANTQRALLIGDPTGGRIGLSMQKERAKFKANITRAWVSTAENEYGDRYLGDISIREVTQNSLDAVLEALERGDIQQGEISIDVLDSEGEIDDDPYAYGYGYRVRDNGIGMNDRTIADKFLSLYDTGKDVVGRFGGFGIAKAVILMPHRTARWVLRTLDNYLTSEMTNNEEIIGTIEPIRGTEIQVMTEHSIIDYNARKYVETTELPKNVTMKFNGKRLRNPFKGIKPVKVVRERVDENTIVTISIYSKRQTSSETSRIRRYSGTQVVRLADPVTGAKLTQGITEPFSLSGAMVIDIETTATPGSGSYPLTKSRTDTSYIVNPTIRRVNEENNKNPFEDISDIDPNTEFSIQNIADRAEWKRTLEKLPTDPIYQRLIKEIEAIYEETNYFFGHGREDISPITHPADMAIWIAKKYKGKRGAGLKHARHLAAYEAVLRLFAEAAGVEIDEFHAILDEGVFAHYGRNAEGRRVTGLNATMGLERALAGPYQYFQFIVDLAKHEMTHFYAMGHNEQFTSALFDRVGVQVAHLYPYVLRLVEAATGESVTVRVREEVTKEVPVETVRTEYINGTQIPLDLGEEFARRETLKDGERPWENNEGGTGSDAPLFYPVGSAEERRQLGLFGRRRIIGDAPVSSEERAAETGGGGRVANPPGVAVSGLAGVPTGPGGEQRGVQAGEGGRTRAIPGRTYAAAPVEASGTMKRMAQSYLRRLDQADTHEKLDRVAEQWAQEKKRPWWINFEQEIKQKRAVLNAIAPPRKPMPGETTVTPVTKAEAARQRRLARTAQRAEAAAAPATTEVAAPARPAPTPREARETATTKRAKKEAFKPGALEQRVLDAIRDGYHTVTEIEKLTGINDAKIRAIMKTLKANDLINLGKQDKEEPGQWRNYATLAGEALPEGVVERDLEAESEAKKQAKKQDGEARSEPAETPYERLKREYEQAQTPREKEIEDRRKTGQAGQLKIFAAKAEEQRDTEVLREHSEWRERVWLDYLMRGGKNPHRPRLTRGQAIAESRMRQTKEAVIKYAQADRRIIDDFIRRVSKDRAHRDRVGAVLVEYLSGGAETEANDAVTIDMVRDVLGLKNDDPILAELERMRKNTQIASARIKESGLLPADVKARMESSQFYLRLAYARHLMGKNVLGRWRRYKPLESDKKVAIDTVAATFAKEIKRLAAQTQDMKLRLPKEFDMIAFLEDSKWKETEHMLDLIDGMGLKKSAANELKRNLTTLRANVQKWTDALTFERSLDGHGVRAIVASDIIRDYAGNAVDILLNPREKIGGGQHLKNTYNLEKRHLTEVFKKLYGEIKDPGVLQALTVETQGNLLAQARFFDEMLDHGEGFVWTTRTAHPRMTEKLGNQTEDRDIFKYGRLAGRYVTPEFKEFLDGKGQIHASLSDLMELGNPDGKVFAAFLQKSYQNLQGTTRMMALMTAGAWWRNLVSSYVTFALQSGDAMHVSFTVSFAKALRTALRAWVGNAGGLRQLAHDMEAGAFNYTQASVVSDLRPAVGVTAQRIWEGDEVGMSAMRAAKNVPRKLKELYILIDYAAKKAAWDLRYNMAKKKGKSDEVAEQFAREWVEKFYQNADRVPKIVQQVGVLGFADFLGFKYDSGRMATNAFINIAMQSKLGQKKSEAGSFGAKWKGILNEHPDLMEGEAWRSLVGFTAARAWPLRFWGLWGPGQYLLAFGKDTFSMSVKGIKFVMSAMGWATPDDEPEEIEEIDEEMQAALNEIMPLYDANMVKWTAGANYKDGHKSLVFVALGSQFGNAFEDWGMGLVQRMNSGGETFSDMVHNLGRPENISTWLPIGMTYSNIYEMVTGYDPQVQFRQANLSDALNKFGKGLYKQAGKEAGEAFINFIADTAGGLGRSYKQYQIRKKRSGREPTKGTRMKEYEGDSPGEVLWEIAKPMVRLLRIKEYDQEEVLRILPYKMGAIAGNIYGNKRAAREAVRTETKLGEATQEELARSEAAMRSYSDGLYKAEARMKTMQPLFDYLGIDKETLVAALDEMPEDSKLTGLERKAIVYGKVKEYLESEDAYKPEPSKTRLQKGEDFVRIQLKKDRFIPVDSLIDMMRIEGYEIDDVDLQRRRIRQLRTEIGEEKREGLFSEEEKDFFDKGF